MNELFLDVYDLDVISKGDFYYYNFSTLIFVYEKKTRIK